MSTTRCIDLNCNPELLWITPIIFSLVIISLVICSGAVLVWCESQEGGRNCWNNCTNYNLPSPFSIFLLSKRVHHHHSLRRSRHDHHHDHYHDHAEDNIIMIIIMIMLKIIQFPFSAPRFGILSRPKPLDPEYTKHAFIFLKKQNCIYIFCAYFLLQI